MARTGEVCASEDREIAAARTVADALAIQVRRNPKAPAILAPGYPALDYGALAGLIDRSALALASAGLGRGKRVAVALGNGPEAAVALLALGEWAAVFYWLAEIKLSPPSRHMAPLASACSRGHGIMPQ